MPRRISIGWLKQRSGNYALKGITIRENDVAYDSTNNFRDEDARWITKTLGAEASVESSEHRGGERIPADYPEWALRSETEDDGVLPIDRERAGATLFRHYLATIAEACRAGSGIDLKKLESELRDALAATDAGSYYTLSEARTIIRRRSPKAVKTPYRPTPTTGTPGGKPAGPGK